MATEQQREIEQEIEAAHRDVEAIRAAFAAVDALLDRSDARLVRLGVLIKGRID